MPHWLRVTAVVVGALVVGAALVVVALLATAPAPQERDEWTLGPELPMAFGELATVSVTRDDGTEVLVVLSGLSGLARVADDVFAYDSASGAWSRGPSLPAPRHHASAAALDGAVVLSGGAEGLAPPWAGSRDVWRWEPGDTEWYAMPPLPEERYGHRMVEFGGRLYVVGGHGETADSYVFDPALDTWAAAAPIPEMRDHLSVVVAGERIWAIGGRGPQNTARVDIYDPDTDRWGPGPPLPEPTSGAAEGVLGGRIYVIGGEDASTLGGGVIDRHWMLDTRAEELRWELVPPPPLAVHGADGTVFEGRMVVVGGAGRHGALSPSAWARAFQLLDGVDGGVP